MNGLQDLKATLDDDFLILKDKHMHLQPVLIDKTWKHQVKRGIYTNLADFVVDFTLRFPTIQFGREEKIQVVNSTQIVDFLFEDLQYVTTELNMNYDSYIDSTKLPPGAGPVLNIGNGSNIVLARTMGKTYRIDGKSTGSIIFAQELVEGSGKVKIWGGHSETALNAVVVSADSQAEVVTFMKGKYELYIEDAGIDDVTVRDGRSYTSIRKKNRNFAKFNKKGGPPVQIIFKQANETQVVYDVDNFIKTKAKKEPYLGYTALIGADKKPKLRLPFSSEQVVFVLQGNDPVWFYFVPADAQDIEEHKYPYMLIPGQAVDPVNPMILVNVLRNQFKAGISFNGTDVIQPEDFCQFMKEKVASNSYVLHYHPEITMSDQPMECRTKIA